MLKLQIRQGRKYDERWTHPGSPGLELTVNCLRKSLENLVHRVVTKSFLDLHLTAAGMKVSWTTIL